MRLEKLERVRHVLAQLCFCGLLRHERVLHVLVEGGARRDQTQTNTLQQCARQPALLPRQHRPHLRRLLVHQPQGLLLVLGVLDHEHFPRGVAARAPDHLLVLARRDVRAAALERVQNHHVYGEVHAHCQRGGGDGHADHAGADGSLENLPLVEREAGVMIAHAVGHGLHERCAARGKGLELLHLTPSSQGNPCHLETALPLFSQHASPAARVVDIAEQFVRHSLTARLCCNKHDHQLVLVGFAIAQVQSKLAHRQSGAHGFHHKVNTTERFVTAEKVIGRVEDLVVALPFTDECGATIKYSDSRFGRCVATKQAEFV